MAQFVAMFQKMIELLIVISFGYLACKIGLLDKMGRKMVSGLVINIGVPALCISSVMGNAEAPTGMELVGYLIISSSSYIILFIIAKLTTKLLQIPESQKGPSEFTLFMKNCAFIGFPVAGAVFGSMGVFYTMVVNTPWGFLCYSLGLMMIRGTKSEGKMTKERFIQGAKDLLLTVPMISSTIALAMAIIGIRGPVIIAEATSICGQITTPLALMIVGSSLAELPILEMIKGFKIYLIAFISLIISPAIIYVILSPLLANRMVLAIIVLMSAMPAAATGTMFCVQYKKDETYMAQCTFITTICSMITIPIVVTALQMLP